MNIGSKILYEGEYIFFDFIILIYVGKYKMIK